MDKVTVTITTCGRVDILQKTIESFTKNNKYPIDEMIMTNDDISNKEILDDLYGDKFQIIHNGTNRGLLSNIDTLFNSSKNEYIFHLEDDWLFDGNGDFISSSIKILKENKDIHQVWVRHEWDNPHPCIQQIESFDDVKYKKVDENFRGVWCGYSWNPGLRRKSDHQKMFPNGVVQFKDEMQCSINVKQFNYRAVLLIPSTCYHIGYGRSTQ